MGGMEKVIQEFLAESFESLDLLDQDLVILEKNPSDREVFERIFRTIHTIKGTCGFLSFHKLESVTHKGEAVLSQLRDGKLELRPEITTELLTMIDGVRTILASIEKTGGEGEDEYSGLIAALGRFEEEAGTGGKPDKPEKPVRAIAGKKQTRKKKGPGPEEKPAAKKRARKPAGKTKTKGDQAATAAAEVAAAEVAAAESAPQEPQPAAGVAPRTSRAGVVEQTGPAVKAKEKEKKPQPSAPEPGPAQPSEPEHAAIELPTSASVGESTIRVDVGVLDQLMTLVGELVLARNQILQHSSTAGDDSLALASQRLSGVTGELQEAVMKTRMQPISAIWNKMPRFVRDLALSFGKQVDIEMEGQETELDKSIIEAIKGSLLHLVRNSVDHGIEDPEVRAARGKPPVGRLALRADHEGGYVVIEVSDDGGGLDHERILERAIANSVVTAERAAELSAREIENLIFLPGFSTARTVTSVSGRGVGLDVVRTNVESIGGSVDLQSELGASTTFRLKIPLTLAIIPVLIVTAGGNRYAIPQVGVVELVRLAGEKESQRIEYLHGAPVYRLRGNLLPLVHLNHELKVTGDSKADEEAINIVVLHGDDRQFGLVVDTIYDTQEIVVKPLGRLLKGLPYAGATILGDGRVSLILDIIRLGLTAGVVSEAHEHARLEAEAAAQTEARDERTTLLYLQGPDDERMAIHFSVVSRLEFLARSRVEYVGGQSVIQYRDEILQLVNLADVLPERRSTRRSDEDIKADAMQVVVCTVDGRRVGLMVERIIDIVEENLRVKRPASREGVSACVVIQGRVTELLDLPAVVRLADPGFFDRPEELLAVV